MPTISLFTPPSHPDAWHQVSAPGGYEWWYFDAEDVEHDRQIAAIFFQGFVFHPGYLRAHARYRRRPTVYAPPLPRDYPCAYFVVYEGGRIVHQFMTQYAPSQFSAATDAPHVTVGPNQIQPAADGSLNVTLCGTPWVLTWQGPRLLEPQTLAAHFTFTPRFHHAPAERIFLSRKLSAAEHHWIVANPLCEVIGTIDCAGQKIEFRGRGYHDHNYGTAPLGPGLKRWIWGRVLFADDSAATFHFARASDDALEDEVHLVEADATGLRETPIATVEADWSRRTGAMLYYPEKLRLENALWLSNPRVIDSSPFYLRLTYNAQRGDRRGIAFCEIAYPHRLRVPVLGRMIEMSIDKRTTDA